MQSTIRFLRQYRSRAAGSVDSQMGYGVHDTLVNRGIAEFVLNAAPSVAAIEPPLTTEVSSEFKARRSYKKG